MSAESPEVSEAAPCEVCASGHWERGWFTGEPVFVHADGPREIYYECDCMDDPESSAAPGAGR